MKFKSNIQPEKEVRETQTSQDSRRMEDIATKMSGIKTLNIEGNIVLSEQSQFKDNSTDKYKNWTGNFSLKLNHDVDFTDPKKPKSSGKFENRLSDNADSADIIRSDMFIKGENITIGKTDYFKFTQFSHPAPFLDFSGSSSLKDLTGIETQWVEIDDLLWHGLQQGNGFFGPSLIPEGQPVTINVLRNLFSRSTVIDELPGEFVDNQQLYHYLVSLDREAMKAMLGEIYYIRDPEHYILRSQERYIIYKMGDDLEKLLDEFLDQLTEIKAEIWVDEEQLIHRTQINLSIDKTEDLQTTEDATELINGIKVNLNFSNFGMPLTINPPEVVKKLEELPGWSGLAFKSESSRRDGIRYDDLHEIAEALYLYNLDLNGKYPESESMPSSIGELDPVPMDPGNGPCPGPYQWIPNIGNPQQFLIYVCYENGKFFAISERLGSSEDQRPTSLYVKPSGL